MKNFTRFFVFIFISLNFQIVFAQSVGFKGFELMGKNQQTIQLNQTIASSTEITPFDGKISPIFGLALNAKITFNGEKSLVRIILKDKQGDEYLIYETYPLLEDGNSVTIDNLCEETGTLNGVKPQSVKIELLDATVVINSITYSAANDQGTDIEKVKKEKKDLQNNRKINQLNKSIKLKGLAWVAGETEISALSYSEKKKLFGQSTFPSGIEYYVGGVLTSGDGLTLKAATATSMVENWDWRNRHGKNWITATKNQGACGSCWAFAATGATEALVNLFYNQPLNMDLSEQNLLSCSGAGTCSGGFPSTALDYVKNTGIIDEAAFPYSATDQTCTNKSSSPTDQIKIGGRVDFGSSAYPVSEDNLKKMLIKYGPVSGGLLDWSHAMTLVGWKVVKEGDRFFYRNLAKSTIWYTVPAGSALIGKTVWIFKNSWGGTWGDGGYVYVETSISNFSWTHALLTQVQSLKQNYTVQCVDNDHDGYYWWGLGSKPANCPPCPDTPDGNDNDATLGPLDSYGNCIQLTTPTVVAPVVNFSTDKTSVVTNGQVQFSDQSTNTPTTWLWTISGPEQINSTIQNPSLVFNTAGTYSVILKASNSGGSATLTKTNYITVTAPQVPVPVVTFSANQTSVIAGGQVQFSDQSTNTPTDWLWTISGPEQINSTIQNPSLVFNTAGIYSVTLKVSNLSGSATLLKTNYITVTAPQVPAPVAAFSANQTSILTSGQVQFSDQSTNTPTAWLWTITGPTATTSTLQNPTINFSVAGNYSVTLKAANATGENTLTKTNFITVSDPLIADFAVDNATINEGQTVVFSDLSTGTAVSWSWSLPGGNPSASNQKNPEVLYSVNGKYDVTLVVTNANGKSTKIKSGYITVNSVVPTYSSSHGNASKEWISQVSLNGTTFNTVTSGITGYSDLTSNAFNVLAGTNYTMTLTPKSTGKSNYWYWSVWVDFNHDFDFDDAGEQILTYSKSKTAISKSMTIPSSALTGSTRMRISMKRDALPSPNEVFAYGEVKDFTVNISAPMAASNQLKSISVENQSIATTLKLTVFPNPTERIINMKLDEIFGNETYTIYNMQGAAVSNEIIESNISQVDVSGLPAGIYVVKVKNGEQILQQKFIKR